MTCAPLEQPEHPATLSSFVLDKYEVTVGRFRAFVEAGAGTQASPPAADSGAHPLIADSGWDSAWDTNLPADQAALSSAIACDAAYQTWTDSAGANEQYPINCISWYEAFAFCIWDGGRLPTDAEWEYAAAGGDQNRVYPWGNDVSDPLPASYVVTDNSPLVPVGSYPGGNGRWGHADLAGSSYEWTLDWFAADWYTATQAGCSDCANLTPGTQRMVRGGGWYSSANVLRAAGRMDTSAPEIVIYYFGFRCARDAE
jgi:formylglycine-generating enzyme required for sulfatase activity